MTGIHDDLLFLGTEGCLRWIHLATLGKPAWPPYERDINWWLHATLGPEGWWAHHGQNDWLPVHLAILENLAALADVEADRVEGQVLMAMELRVRAIAERGPSPGDPVLDPAHVFRWAAGELPPTLAVALADLDRARNAMLDREPASDKQRAIARFFGDPEPSGGLTHAARVLMLRTKKPTDALRATHQLGSIDGVSIPPPLVPWLSGYPWQKPFSPTH